MSSGNVYIMFMNINMIKYESSTGFQTFEQDTKNYVTR